MAAIATHLLVSGRSIGFCFCEVPGGMPGGLYNTTAGYLCAYTDCTWHARLSAPLQCSYRWCMRR